MRGGDLSNDLAPGVGIRFERVIRSEEGKLNKAAKGFMLQLMSLDVNLYIITTEPARKAMSFCAKWGVPYTHVIGVDSYFEVADVVRENGMLSYYDVDMDILQNVNSRGGGKVDAKQWTLV